MPFLFWMPLIVMRGLWDLAEESTRALMQEDKPKE